MFQLLLVIISYGALLILIMPPTGAGVIMITSMFLLGVGLIAFIKPYKDFFEKSKPHFLVPISIFIAVHLGLVFYSRWLPSHKMQAIASLLHTSKETMLFMGAIVLASCSLLVICAIMRILTQKLSAAAEKNHLAGDLLFCLTAAVTTVILAQVMIDTEVFSMGYFKFFAGVLIVSVVILFFYCIFQKCIPAVFTGAGIFMILSTVNVYVYKFRGRLFEPLDIFSARTAINVAGNYSLFPIPLKILTTWGIFAAMLIIFRHLQQKRKTNLSPKKRLALLAVCSVCSVAVILYGYNLKTYHWHTEGAEYNGYILDFVSKFKEISVSEPDNYSTDLISNLAAEYKADGSGNVNEPSENPHIIVIMDEAFSDLQVIGDFSTNMEVTPFISSLNKNTVRGYALASVYGGNTANSEYEFLTGHSLAWLSPNVVPYQQYVREPTYSMVSYLKSAFDYKAIAMHPYLSSGWNRPLAYEYLGFDEYYFVENFPQTDLIREYVSDQEMFEFLTETYEAQKEDPLFIFGVTMQNHGGYTYSGNDFTNCISLDEHANQFPEVEQYLSLIHETDKAVEYLITYFQNVEDDVIIVFFGDHQPKLSESFYETVSGTAADTLDEQQKRYQIPFFIWANYDIEDKYIDCTSLNYLSSYVYDAAGIALPPYNRFLTEMETQIPSINANGYYSLAAGCYLPFDEANEEERSWLELYEALQYHNIFDKSHQNRDFFPLPE